MPWTAHCQARYLADDSHDGDIIRLRDPRGRKGRARGLIIEIFWKWSALSAEQDTYEDPAERGKHRVEVQRSKEERI